MTDNPESKLSDTVTTWQNAALNTGEHLASVGPDGYYSFTPFEWMEWANNEIDKLKARVAELETQIACAADFGNTWARESGVTECNHPYSDLGLKNLIDRLWSRASSKEVDLREQLSSRDELLKEMAKMLKKATIRHGILLGRANGCEAGNHSVTQMEVPGWIEEQNDLLAKYEELKGGQTTKP